MLSRRIGGVNTPTEADQTNPNWQTLDGNLNVGEGGSLIFKVTESASKDFNTIIISSSSATSAYFGVEDNAYDEGARLTLNLKGANSQVQFSSSTDTPSSVIFAKGTTVNLVNFDNGTFSVRGSELVFDSSVLNITLSEQVTPRGILNLDTGSVYFRNGALLELSATDPLKQVQLFAGRKSGNSSFYVQSGAKVTFSSIRQDATSGEINYEVSGRGSVFTITSTELDTSTGSVRNSNYGAYIGHYAYTGSDTTTLRIADGGKFVVQGFSRNSNYQLNSGLKVYKNGILQLAPTSANNARQAGGSSMVEATAINFSEGARLELDLSGLTAMSEEFKTSDSVFAFDLLKVVYSEELGQILDIYKDNVYTGDVAGSYGTKLEWNSESAAIEEFLAGLINEDYISTINGEFWDKDSLEWFYSDGGDGYVLGFTMEYIGQYVPVPEPSAYAAIFGALALLLAIGRRKK